MGVLGYPLWVTCDSCANGHVPCRVDGDAYICFACDREHDMAVHATASTLGMTFADVNEVVDAYLEVRERMAREEAGVES